MTPELAEGIKIRKIAYTPVKSVAMLEVSEARLTPLGLYAGDVRDRTWMAVDATPDKNGVYQFVTQRDRGMNKMALIQPHVTPDALHLTWKGADPIGVPRDLNTGTEMRVQVWKDTTGGAIDQGDAAAEWLSDHLGKSVRLVKATDAVHRKVSEKYGANDDILRGWQDSYPVHWASQETLDELSQRVGTTMDWRRFRPNILVDGVPEPDYEHQVFNGKFGEVPFQNIKPCDRCSIPPINPETGERDVKGLLKTLGQYKSWTKPSGEIMPILGENALIRNEGLIAVGQEVTVVDLRSPQLVYGRRN